MSNQITKSSIISGRNIRYDIFCKVHEDLSKNIHVKKINENSLLGNTPTFQRLGSRISLFGRQAKRYFRGPISTDQYSGTMGQIKPERPSLMPAFRQLARAGLKTAIMSGINTPTARGNVPNVLSGVRLGNVLQTGMNVRKTINTSIAQQRQNLASPTLAQTPVPSNNPPISQAQLNNQIISLRQEIARRGAQDIDLLPSASRTNRVVALRSAQARLKSLISQQGNRSSPIEIMPESVTYRIVNNKLYK